jgi:uncharacterized protein (TIRG00374 family)
MTKILIGLLLLGALIRLIPLTELKQAFLSARMRWIPVCFLFGFIGPIMQGYMLQLLSNPFAKISYWRALAFTLIGKFVSQFLPSGIAGDVIKAIYLLPHFRDSAHAYAALAALRILGALSTLAVAIIAVVIWLPHFMVALGHNLIVTMIIVLCIALFGMLVIYLSPLSLYSPVIIWFNATKAGSILRRTWLALLFYLDRKRLLAECFVLSAISTIVSACVYLVLAFTLRVPITFPQALFATCASMVSVILPLTPGGLGVGEGAFVMAAHLIGAPPEHTVPLAIFARIVSYGCSIPGAISLAAIRHNSGLRIQGNRIDGDRSGPA